MEVQLQAETRPEDILPEVPIPIRLGDGLRESSSREFILPPQENVCCVGLDGEGAQNHPFDQLVGISFQEQPVLEGARLHFIAVADQVSGPLRLGTHGDETPL